MAKNKTLELSIKIAGKVDKSLYSALTGTQNQISAFSTSISKIGTAGLAAMGALGAGTAKILSDCTKEASKFENYIADSVKVVEGLTDASGNRIAGNITVLDKTMKDLSTQIPYTYEELAKLTEAAGQSGKVFDELSDGKFIKDIAMWGTAMDISADQAGKWGAKWEQAFKMNHDQIMDVADVINYLGNNYATTAAEIAEVVNDSGAMGQLVNIDPEETAAIAAAMLAMGGEAAHTATSVNRMYTNLSKGSAATKAQETAWNRLGFTATQIAEMMQADGTGTLQTVFAAINNLPEAEKLSTLNTLFGQWAIQDAAKITKNLDLLGTMLGQVNDKNLWTGSMMKEFIIKAETPEAVSTMLGNTKSALMAEIGAAFLPAQKEFSLSMIEFLNSIRNNMPELTKLADSLGELASRGVAKLGDAMDKAIPYIKQGLDYLLKNGDKVASTIGMLAAAFVGMKFAPAAEGLLSGAGSLIFGSGGAGTRAAGGGKTGGLFGLFQKGQTFGSNLAQAASIGYQEAVTAPVTRGGFFRRVFTGLSASSSAMKNMGGLNSGRAGAVTTAWNRIGAAAQNAASLGPLGMLKNKIATSAPGQYMGNVGSSIGNFFGSITNTKAVSPQSILQMGATKATGLNFFGNIANAAKAGGGVLGSIWGPVLGGFGSLVTGAVPVVGAISAIIAAVSLLDDKFGILDKVFEKLFGEEGPAKLAEFKTFMDGIFNGDGLIKALEGPRQVITDMFGEKAGAAFGGLVNILQTVMNVAGQVVTFATTTVKPIIEGIFNFITQTVVPILLQAFTAAAPFISGIISGLGSAVMTVMEIIGSAIQGAMPIIQGIIEIILTVGSVAIPAILSAIEVFSKGVGDLMGNVQRIFGGLMTFITGVFTLDWKKAWDGIKEIFGGAFDALVTLCKTPINAVIKLINSAIEGINGLGLDIPEWLPLLGGKKFSINIPEIPMLAKGGFTRGASIAGEAGTEAVISFQRSVRRENLRTWAKAGQMLGVKPAVLLDIPEGAGGGQTVITFAPQIIIQGNADRDVIDEAMERARAEFENWYKQMQRRQARTAY